jgi:hypothetical protein
VSGRAGDLMKTLYINQKVSYVRHWFRWYIVTKGGTEWRDLKVRKRIYAGRKPKPFDLDKTVKKLEAKNGPARVPAILDEKAADRTVAKNIAKARIKKG